MNETSADLTNPDRFPIKAEPGRPGGSIPWTDADLYMGVRNVRVGASTEHRENMRIVACRGGITASEMDSLNRQLAQTQLHTTGAAKPVSWQTHFVEDDPYKWMLEAINKFARTGNAAYTYNFIENLETGVRSRFESEIASLAELWRRRKSQTTARPAVEKFETELKRLWSIEAGELENLYFIDRGLTETLIVNGFNSSLIPFLAGSRLDSEQLSSMLRAHELGLELVFSFVSSKRTLSKSLIKELHAVLVSEQKFAQGRDQFGNRIEVELIAGDWKTQSNNPTRPDGFVHEYCPPIHVEAEMDNLLKWHNEHVSRHVAPEIEAAWLHHRFTQIHPFQDGNGRVARALASFVLVRAGCFPLVFLKEKRGEYIETLEYADAGYLDPFVRLVSTSQRTAFMQAFQADSVLFSPLTEDLNSSALEAISARAREARAKLVKNGLSEDLAKVIEVARTLLNSANSRMHVVAEEITKEIGQVTPSYKAQVVLRQSDFDYQQDVRVISQKQEYFADLHTCSDWCRLQIEDTKVTEIVIHVHGFGVRFDGVLAVSAFLNQRSNDLHFQALKKDGPYVLTDLPFLITASQPIDDLEDRFRLWTNEVIDAGTQHWLRRL